MIMVRAPFRVSFAGGGSDLEEFYSKNGYGAVLSTSINKYMYIMIHPYFHDKIRIKYSKTEDVEKIEELSPEKKWAFFNNTISRCIRCYACRNACPLCYCPTCFVDESTPQWVGKSIDPIDTMTFHFLRAYHCAGRCTDCGACERVCPVGIPVRQFTKKLNKDAQDLFSWEAGLTMDQRPLLDVYRPDDYNDFIK